MKPDLRKCRYCGKRFEKTKLFKLLPQVCWDANCRNEYFLEYSERIKEQGRKKLERKRKAEDRKAKEKLKTHGQWLKDLQRVFNAYIRKRDEAEPCISCGKFAEYYDASHYWSVGGYPALRFNEANCHKSCIFCNQHLHGNIAEYTPRLIEKIGQAEFDKLKSERHNENKLTIAEIKELIEHYKTKIKRP